MKRNVVITVMGADRPGIVEMVSEILVQHDANIEKSRMARLGGEFAGIILATVEDSKIEGLLEDLQILKERELEVTTKISSPEPSVQLVGYVPYELFITGADHEGIVHSITDYLASQGINIEELSADVFNAPISGTPLFSMRSVIEVPPQITMANLKEKLAQIAASQGVDIELKLLIK